VEFFVGGTFRALGIVISQRQTLEKKQKSDYSPPQPRSQIRKTYSKNKNSDKAGPRQDACQKDGFKKTEQKYDQ
jgi:hypothetical protein